MEDLKIGQGAGVRPSFPPVVEMEVKALACQLPRESGVPLSRFSNAEIAREVVSRGIAAQISGATVWRLSSIRREWLGEDAIRPWHHKSWIFPRAPDFQEKAERVLDLYQGIPDEYVISADEKTSIQARSRRHAVIAPGPGENMRVEHEYERKGSLAYLAAWDVRRAKVFGRCEVKSGIKAFDCLVDQIMSQEPYLSAKAIRHRIYEQEY